MLNVAICRSLDNYADSVWFLLRIFAMEVKYSFM